MPLFNRSKFERCVLKITFKLKLQISILHLLLHREPLETAIRAEKWPDDVDDDATASDSICSVQVKPTMLFVLLEYRPD